MKRAILVFGLLLCSAAFADLMSSLAKLEAYVEQQGYTWQQIRDAAPQQWRNHAIAAGFTVDEMRRFPGIKNTLRRLVVYRRKRAIVRTNAKALLTHIRKVGPDTQTFPLLRELTENWQEYGIDPNAVNITVD